MVTLLGTPFGETGIFVSGCASGSCILVVSSVGLGGSGGKGHPASVSASSDESRSELPELSLGRLRSC